LIPLVERSGGRFAFAITCVSNRSPAATGGIAAMSTVTRTVTPPYSANPFQAFVTYKQARRAAKGGGVVAIVYGALSVLGVLQLMTMNLPPLVKQVNLVVIGVLTLLMFLLGWRLWVKPGPWKALVLLILTLLSFLGVLVQFSVLNMVIMGVTLNFAVIAFRGALAMKGLQAQAQMKADLDVF
jgi:hypothetical protein